jgi:hypothetical protein
MFATFEELQDYLGIKDVESAEEPLYICLTAADSFIRTFTNRALSLTRFAHELTPINPYEVIVPEFPVTAIHGMTAFQFMSDTTGYVIDMSYVRFRKSGLIHSSEGFFVPGIIGSVLIDYTAGYTTTDVEYETLRWVTLEIAGQFFRGRGLMNMTSYQAGGSQFQKYDVKATDVGAIYGMLGPEVALALGSFAVRGPRSVDR